MDIANYGKIVYTACMDMYSVEEAAALLGVSERTVRHRLQTGVMKGERAGKWTWLVSHEEVNTWTGRGKLPPGRKKAYPPVDTNGGRR